MSANRISQLLDREDMTVAGAASLCGVSTRTVERWMATGRIPDEHKRTLCSRFLVGTEYLLGWDRFEAKASAA